ncbi:MAG: hypothetical protein ACYS6K_02025 [Planctomycetota bacterium]|jgi:hypothetical protein
MANKFFDTNRFLVWFMIGLLCIGCTIPETVTAQVWTQFEMNSKDIHGNYLWTTSENWNRGLPNPDLSVEIGDDHSGKALHCVIPKGYDAVCQNMELAEHGRTQGTTLRLEEGASLTIRESGVLSKDRESWLYVDGTLNCTKQGKSLRVGGPWGRPDINEPARCHLMIGPKGVVNAWFVGINTDLRAENTPSTPWGPRFFARSTGSEIVNNGGKLIARQGLRISTCEADRPGVLRLRGKATFTSKLNSKYGIDIWGGILEIEGGQAGINVGDIEFWGNKFKDAINTKTNNKVGPGLAVLKLTGDDISTIHARKVNFVDAAVLDVSGLKVSTGTYRVIEGATISGTNLHFAPDTDTSKWSFKFDKAKGDLMLKFTP